MLRNIDFWNGQTFKDVAAATCTFYPNEGTYRGNIFNSKGEMIGDYEEPDSVKIEKVFPGIFGE